MHAHFPCRRAECLARKFVVFGSAIDLKAHQVEEHGAEMSARDKRDARRVQAEFEFEEVGGAPGRRGRRDRGDREREREPPPHAPPTAQPPGANGSRPQAAGARRREAFGGNLTANGASLQANSSRRQSPSPSPADGDPRLSALVARVASLAPNPTNAIPAVKAAVRSYRATESAARDLISTVWSILDRNLDGTASVVNVLVDAIDEEDKKRDLLSAWNGFKLEVRHSLDRQSLSMSATYSRQTHSTATEPIPRARAHHDRLRVGRGHERTRTKRKTCHRDTLLCSVSPAVGPCRARRWFFSTFLVIRPIRISRSPCSKFLPPIKPRRGSQYLDRDAVPPASTPDAMGVGLRRYRVLIASPRTKSTNVRPRTWS